MKSPLGARVGRGDSNVVPIYRLSNVESTYLYRYCELQVGYMHITRTPTYFSFLCFYHLISMQKITNQYQYLNTFFEKQGCRLSHKSLLRRQYPWKKKQIKKQYERNKCFIAADQLRTTLFDKRS